MPAWPFEMLRREFDGRIEPASAGSWFTKSAMLFDGDERWISSMLRTVSGVGASNPSRTMREPVTRISRFSPSGPSDTTVVLVAEFCAYAGAAPSTIAASAVPETNAARFANDIRM